MQSSPTELYLPPSFPYPIKITSIDARTSTPIQRGTRLLSYSFVYLASSPNSQPETRFGTWDSAIEGSIDSWKVKPGDVLSQGKAKEKPVVVVIEPCKHGMQLGGLCVLCGKDMTNSDYTGFSDASRASIQMTHSAFGPTVSLEEAQRIERETAERLLKSRKLSLIVDLDQTIVHATVDPTVGEWISEGEAWEARQAKKASTSKVESDDSDDSLSDDGDECNPNWEALKDVKKFRLGPESFGMPTPRGSQAKARHKMIESEGVMYYIKPRPGWKEFLQDMATNYEMHVYTMGTRAYAEEVCAAIDPDGKIFGGRLLSRDESGSLTQKSLQRLFPCDTSMVVIIDDRADVWEWSPNLIKVIPYDFFVGIGDINSTFLPKLEPLTPSSPARPPPVKTPPSSSTTSQTPPSPEETERAALETKAMVTQNNRVLEAQVEERPLAKKQEELQGESTPSEADDGKPPLDTKGDKDDSKSTSSRSEKGSRKALLKNDDLELQRVSKLLEEVHTRFFSAYDSRPSDDTAAKRKPGHSRKHESPKPSYNVTQIIPRIRSEVLKGIHVLFSSVIPLDTRPESTEIWRMAHMFGAKCSTELTSEITHVVAAKRGTVKVDTARKRGGIKIVWLAWFTDSVALWRHQDETPYLLDEPVVGGPSTITDIVTDPAVSSLDPDPGGEAADEGRWDEPPASFELDEINWNDINDEVEAAMNESEDGDEDDGDGDDAKSDVSRRSGMSEDNFTDETGSNNSPRLKRKRLRSMTPSAADGINGASNGKEGEDDGLRSPLAKRKKIVAERSGYSKLKVAISADDLPESDLDNVVRSAPSSPARDSKMGDGAEDEEEEEDGDEDEEEDFLAKEFEAEWG